MARAALLILALTSPGLADAPPAADRGTVIVTLADGSTVPLRGWTLSYEYALYGKGVSPIAAPTSRHNTGDLYLGKRALSAAALGTLDITYQQMGTIAVARTISFKGPNGKTEKEKVETPNVDLVVKDRPKGTEVMIRTLDLRGETVTGTKKDFCVLSYTSIVQCGTTLEDRVVKLEFQR
jgi:hypothetical protein